MNRARWLFVAFILIGVLAAIAGCVFSYIEGYAADDEHRSGWILHWWMAPMAAAGATLAVASAVALGLTNRRRPGKSA